MTDRSTAPGTLGYSDMTPPQRHADPLTAMHNENLQHQTLSRNVRRPLLLGRLLVIVMTLCMLALLGRAIQLQATPDDPIRTLIGSQQSHAALLGRRGNLVDRNERQFAVTSTAHRLFVDPFLVSDPYTFAQRVHDELGYNPETIAGIVLSRRNARFVVIDPRMSEQRVKKMQSVRIPGLSTQTWLVREYPQNELAGHVIGAVGFEGRGLEGLEMWMNKNLQGQPGHYAYLRDASRRPLWIDSRGYTAPQDGDAIRLSLDVNIQSIAESELRKACEKYQAQAGQVVVMNPRTGEILAMANYPEFDPNELSRSTPDGRRNRCVTDVFEPGSIFKPFVWAAAIEIGAARPNEMFDCTTSGVWTSPQGRRLRDAHAHGTLSWIEVLAKSSNIGMAQVGIRMGPAKLHNIVRAFGFGTTTGSGLPGESPGIVNPLKQWNHYSLTSVPMGQEVAVTPLQLARAFCVLANDGLLVVPSIRAYDPHHDAESVTIQERIIGTAAARQTRMVLRHAVVSGTGKQANSKLYTVFGKTGTAQVPDRVRGGYLPNQYVGSFIGGAPVEQPRIVVSCHIHRPNKSKGYYGGIVAAPVAKNVIEQTLLYLGVQPDVNEFNATTTQVVHLD